MIYTRTGDAGTTSLVGGQRVSKTHPRLEAYGTIDELSSHIGLLSTLITDETDRRQLTDIQTLLFTIGSMLATDTTARDYRPGRYILPSDVETLEHAIDTAEAGLGAWPGFILPGGTTAAAQAHVCRTVCRRAERAIYAVAAEWPVDTMLTTYINRLSDYLFVLARLINHRAGTPEQVWKARAQRD